MKESMKRFSSFIFNWLKTSWCINKLLTLNRDVPLNSHLGCDLSTLDSRYLAVGHTTSVGRREQPSSSMNRSWHRYYPVLIYRSRMMEGWVGLAAREYRKICSYDVHGEPNPGRSYGSTMIYPSYYSSLEKTQWTSK